MSFQDYKLIRTNRKTVAICVTSDGLIEIRAPLRTPINEIEQIVTLKQNWINKHLSSREKILAEKNAFTLDYGSLVILRGKKYPISAADGNRVGFDGDRFFIPPRLPPGEIKRAAVTVYRLCAKVLLTEKTAGFAAQMRLYPTAVKINGAKTRWGSCSGKNSINFSWYLVMADDDVIDYVVVHELAHIAEHNHSDKFWSIVEGTIPDYRERRAKLKELQERLATEDWE